MGRRIRAAWLDIAALAVLFVLLALLSGTAHVGTWNTPTGQQHGFSVSLPTGMSGVFAILVFLYYFVPEARTGQSLGKRLTGVRVVALDGSAPNHRAVALRTLGRFIDFLPAFYLVGWLALKRDRDPRQRIGDRIARTTVTLIRT